MTVTKKQKKKKKEKERKGKFPARGGVEPSTH